ncbi:hypothetical protein RJ639_001834 [Escallonia herrerae]|uniref:G domain-containing protein n=1 Tax=Escallonia herrerae TaxID=1293975 RepID=A0AA89BFU2_9ASTE|nr:hypothetical protein RJ639_001834 [Escallonia herrerae]
MIIRTLSPSKLKRLLSFSLSSHTHPNLINPAPFIPPPIFHPQTHPYSLNPAKTLFLRPFSSLPNTQFPAPPLTRDGNYDVSTSQSLPICPGCGIPMQGVDRGKPGFFVKPLPKSPDYKRPINQSRFLEETHISDSVKTGMLTEPENAEQEYPNSNSSLLEQPLVCSRCHSLRYYGQVKDPTAENLLPDFDFDHTVGRRLNLVRGARTVVLMVVDAVDFDGSFPRVVAKLVSKTIDENYRGWKEGKSGNVPRLVLVVTKIDLLPSSIAPDTFEHWVRARARDGGATKLTSLHLVSAVRDWGLKNLVDDVVGLAGKRGQVWAIGAQNAGKSTLINAIGKCVSGSVTHLTEAPVPGTTLGIVRVEGVLPGQAKLFDTPGLLHPHQISTRLTREEQRLVHIRKELKPRTYRIKAGHSVHIAGLMRLDIEESSADSIYVTPPIGQSRVAELGEWVRKEVRVSGSCWDSSSVDIAAAGLGWFAIGLKGEAILGVWTYEGVDLSVRNALVPHKSRNFEVAGFTISKIVSKADRASNKQQKNEITKKKKVKKPNDSDAAAPAATISLTFDAQPESS